MIFINLLNLDCNKYSVVELGTKHYERIITILFILSYSYSRTVFILITAKNHLNYCYIKGGN